MQTIITQDGICLNYRYIREIGIYDAEDDDKKYFCLISGKNEKGEDVPFAAYSTPEEGESAFKKLTNAFIAGREVFSFEDEENTKIVNELKENAEPEKPSYRNRFIEKEKDR